MLNKVLTVFLSDYILFRKPLINFSIIFASIAWNAFVALFKCNQQICCIFRVIVTKQIDLFNIRTLQLSVMELKITLPTFARLVEVRILFLTKVAHLTRSCWYLCECQFAIFFIIDVPGFHIKLQRTDVEIFNRLRIEIICDDCCRNIESRLFGRKGVIWHVEFFF